MKYLQTHYGLKTVVDLRNPNSANEGWQIKREKGWAEELGLNYINQPTTSSSALKLASQIRKILENTKSGAVLIHCQGGKDRTGAVVAFIRMQDGWTYKEAKKEMEKYGHKSQNYEIFHKHLRKFWEEKLSTGSID